MNPLRMTAALARHATNPFATRHTRPGAIPPLDDEGRPRNLEKLLAAIDRLGGSAAIRGPHGTGKSNLLAALGETLADRGEQVRCIRIRRPGGSRPVIRALRGMPQGGILCLDSWDELGTLGSLLVVLQARLRGVRLVVTSHRAGLLPTLVRTRGTPAVLAGIVRRLPAEAGRLTKADLMAAFAHHHGNLRESLASLYDRIEERRRL
jgi:hypothetical protein